MDKETTQKPRKTTSTTSSKQKKAGNNLFFLRLLVLLLFFALGFWAYRQTEQSLSKGPLSLMQRAWVTPEWHAGKLGEAFANQKCDDGKCHFFCYSTLLFAPPKEYKEWQRLEVEVEIPQKSFFLVLMEKSGSHFKHGFRIGRSPDYPSGYILMRDQQAMRPQWSDVENMLIPKSVTLTLLKKEGKLLFLCNDVPLGTFALDQFKEYQGLRFVAGPQGATVDRLILHTTTREDSRKVLVENFSPTPASIDWTKPWRHNIGVALLVFLLLCILCYLSSTLLIIRNVKFLVALLLLSWLLWPLFFIIKNPILILGVKSALWIVVAYLIITAIRKPLHHELKCAETDISQKLSRQPHVSTFIPNGLLIVLLFISICLVLYHEEMSVRRTLRKQPQPNVLQISDSRKIQVGEKFSLSEDVTDFQLSGTLRLKENSITEIVFRKYRGANKNRCQWYSLTLSRNPRHPSGLYITLQDFQNLLLPLDIKREQLQELTFTLSVHDTSFSIQLNGNTYSYSDQRYKRGELSIVPITEPLTITSLNFKPLLPALNSLDILHSLFPLFILWAVVLTCLFLYWQYLINIKTPFRNVIGFFISLLPWFLTFLPQLDHRVLFRDRLWFAVMLSLFFIFLFRLFTNSSQYFFQFHQLLILLLCLEAVLRIHPEDSRLTVNPIQSNIPPSLYWYRAASARRWNSFIMHQQFRNGVFSAFVPPGKRWRTVRLLCLGSSSTAGGYPQYIEKFLDSKGMANVEVIDAGIPGTTTVQLVNFYLNELRQFNADLVTFCLIRNDIKFFANTESKRIFELETSSKGLSPFKAAIYSHLNRFMLYRLYRYYLFKAINGLVDAEASSKLTKMAKQHPLANSLKIYERNVRAFIEGAREVKQQPILIVEPFFVSDGYDRLPQERFDSARRLLFSLGEQYNIPVIDVPKLIKARANDILFIDDVHHNEYGKWLIGKYIGRRLQRYIRRTWKKKKKRAKIDTHVQFKAAHFK